MTVLRTVDPDDGYKREVVERLEKLLRAARDGEVLSLSYVCERPGGAVTVGSTRIKDRYMLLGYLAYAQHQTALSIDEDGVPSQIGEGG